MLADEDRIVSFTLLTPTTKTRGDQYESDTQQHIFHTFKRVYIDSLPDGVVPLDLQLTVHDLNSAWTAPQQIRPSGNTVFEQFYSNWHKIWGVIRRRCDVVKKIQKEAN